MLRAPSADPLSLAPRPGRLSGFTMVEVLVVAGIVVLLIALLIPVTGNLRARAQRAQCAANLRNLHVGASLYVQQNGHWPQVAMFNDEDTASEQYATGWIEALKPFGVERKTWICPTTQAKSGNPDYTTAEGTRIDYFATPFDDKPTTPHQWPRQPWFAEVGDVHGKGPLVVFTDGSISDFVTIVENTSPAPK